MSEELKPCPFCGSTRVHIAGAGAAGVLGVSWTFCHGCFSKGGICDTVEEAVELWNRRAERTCQDVEGGDFFRCSKCGCEVMRVADGWKPLYMGEVNYCPNCGAKVVRP